MASKETKKSKPFRKIRKLLKPTKVRELDSGSDAPLSSATPECDAAQSDVPRVAAGLSCVQEAADQPSFTPKKNNFFKKWSLRYKKKNNCTNDKNLFFDETRTCPSSMDNTPSGSTMHLKSASLPGSIRDCSRPALPSHYDNEYGYVNRVRTDLTNSLMPDSNGTVPMCSSHNETCSSMLMPTDAYSSSCDALLGALTGKEIIVKQPLLNSPDHLLDMGTTPSSIAFPNIATTTIDMLPSLRVMDTLTHSILDTSSMDCNREARTSVRDGHIYTPKIRTRIITSPSFNAENTKVRRSVDHNASLQMYSVDATSENDTITAPVLVKDAINASSTSNTNMTIASIGPSRLTRLPTHIRTNPNARCFTPTKPDPRGIATRFGVSTAATITGTRDTVPKLCFDNSVGTDLSELTTSFMNEASFSTTFEGTANLPKSDISYGNIYSSGASFSEEYLKDVQNTISFCKNSAKKVSFHDSQSCGNYHHPTTTDHTTIYVKPKQFQCGYSLPLSANYMPDLYKKLIVDLNKRDYSSFCNAGQLLMSAIPESPSSILCNENNLIVKAPLDTGITTTATTSACLGEGHCNVVPAGVSMLPGRSNIIADQNVPPDTACTAILKTDYTTANTALPNTTSNSTSTTRCSLEHSATSASKTTSNTTFLALPRPITDNNSSDTVGKISFVPDVVYSVSSCIVSACVHTPGIVNFDSCSRVPNIATDTRLPSTDHTYAKLEQLVGDCDVNSGDNSLQEKTSKLKNKLSSRLKRVSFLLESNDRNIAPSLSHARPCNLRVSNITSSGSGAEIRSNSTNFSNSLIMTLVASSDDSSISKMEEFCEDVVDNCFNPSNENMPSDGVVCDMSEKLQSKSCESNEFVSSRILTDNSAVNKETEMLAERELIERNTSPASDSSVDSAVEMGSVEISPSDSSFSNCEDSSSPDDENDIISQADFMRLEEEIRETAKEIERVDDLFDCVNDVSDDIIDLTAELSFLPDGIPAIPEQFSARDSCVVETSELNVSGNSSIVDVKSTMSFLPEDLGRSEDPRITVSNSSIAQQTCSKR